VNPQSSHDHTAEQRQAAQRDQTKDSGRTGCQCHEFATRSVNYVNFQRNYINDAPQGNCFTFWGR
jgi:nicotinic acid phosphoribosyltransferase